MKQKIRTISTYIVKPIMIKKLLEKNGYKLEHIVMSSKVKGFGHNVGGKINVYSKFLDSRTNYGTFLITHYRSYTVGIEAENSNEAKQIDILLNKNSFTTLLKDTNIQIINKSN